MKIKKKNIKDASSFGVNVKVDQSLNKLSGKVLFPEKLKIANEVVSKLKWVK